jgi:hypothetical protein
MTALIANATRYGTGYAARVLNSRGRVVYSNGALYATALEALEAARAIVAVRTAPQAAPVSQAPCAIAERAMDAIEWASCFFLDLGRSFDCLAIRTLDTLNAYYVMAYDRAVSHAEQQQALRAGLAA